MKTLKDLNLKEEDNFKIRKMLINWVEEMNYCYKEKSEFYPNGSPYILNWLKVGCRENHLEKI